MNGFKLIFNHPNSTQTKKIINLLIDTTYQEKSDIKRINQVIGPPFSLFKKLKMGGVGSQRMIVDEVSEGLRIVLNTVSDINYANIQLRPKGILILFARRDKTFTWIIPYFRLVIYKVNGIRIYANGEYVQFRTEPLFTNNQKFFIKLMKEKANYLKDNELPR